MTIHFGNPDTIKSIADAVPRYARKEFGTPTRSTIPLLTLLQNNAALFNEIVVTKIGFPPGYDFFLEYTVGPFNGRGTASHSDVMLKSDDRAFAIEAKWTEPMYAKIRDWPKKGTLKTANQTAVLKGWLDCLGNHREMADFDGAIYQMVHRAASAAYVGTRPTMAYFLFQENGKPRGASSDAIFDRLGSLWECLGKPAAFPFWVVDISMQATAAYESLRNLPKGSQSTSEAVVAALQGSEPLFLFSCPRIRRVGVDL